MVVHTPTSPTTPSPPPIGTYIDNGALQLVEILGYGGYGIVYRAIPTFHSSSSSSATPVSYAVKCLPQNTKKGSSAAAAARQRQLQLRETELHAQVSGHPNVVTLHRVITPSSTFPTDPHTYIILAYAPSQDLFTRILHTRTYLSNTPLIKSVFLQLIEAVQWCHSQGVFHRDLKPENVMCWDDGKKVAIGDFGLATRDIWSREWRTGSVYHMSPECHGPPSGVSSSHFPAYSPASSDIWSLGIILLNLITGRNPWKSASPTDPTFQAYLASPYTFLMSVLPISQEANEVFVGTPARDGMESVGGLLNMEYTKRLPYGSWDVLKAKIRAIETFYDSDVVFESGMARCKWEVDGSADEEEEEESPVEPHIPEGWAEAEQDTSGWRMQEQAQQAQVNSHWSSSDDGDSPMVFANGHRHHTFSSSSWTPTPISPVDTQDRSFIRYELSRSRSPSPSSRYSIRRSSRSRSRSPVFRRRTLLEEIGTPSQPSRYSSSERSHTPSPPITPPATLLNNPTRNHPRNRLTMLTPLDTTGCRAPYQRATPTSARPTVAFYTSPTSGVRDDDAMISAHSYDEDSMRTALDSGAISAVGLYESFWMKSSESLIPMKPVTETFMVESDSSSSEEDDDMGMGVQTSQASNYGGPSTRHFGSEDGMEYTYTYTYTYSYSELSSYSYTRTGAAEASSTAVDNHSPALNEATSRLLLKDVEEDSKEEVKEESDKDANRMSIVPMTPASPLPGKPDSPVLGLDLSFDATVLPLPLPTPLPIPIPPPSSNTRPIDNFNYEYNSSFSFMAMTNTTGNSKFVGTTAANSDNSIYSIPRSEYNDATNVTNSPFTVATIATTANSPYSAPSFSFSTYPSFSNTSPSVACRTLVGAGTTASDSFSFLNYPPSPSTFPHQTPQFQETGLESPPPLPIRPPPSPATRLREREQERGRSRFRGRDRSSSRTRPYDSKDRKATGSRTTSLSFLSSMLAFPRRSGSGSQRGSSSSRNGPRAGSYIRSGAAGLTPPPPTPAISSTLAAQHTPPPPPHTTPVLQNTRGVSPEKQGFTHFTLSTSISICAAAAGVDEDRRRGRRKSLRALKSAWFSPGRLFASVLPSSAV